MREGPSKCARRLDELSNLSVNVAAGKETHFTCAVDCRVLEDDYVVLSAFGGSSSVGVCLLIGRSLNADVKLVLVDDGAGWLWPKLPLKAPSSAWSQFRRLVSL